MRRVYLRGHPNILKRLLIHVTGLNLGPLLRQVIGVRAPRGAVDLLRRACSPLWVLVGPLVASGAVRNRS